MDSGVWTNLAVGFLAAVYAVAAQADAITAEDLQVEAERDALHISGIALEALSPPDQIPSRHLGEAGDPGPDLVAASLPWRVVRQVLHQ